jgi:hypothetical protein
MCDGRPSRKRRQSGGVLERRVQFSGPKRSSTVPGWTVHRGTTAMAGSVFLLTLTSNAVQS